MGSVHISHELQFGRDSGSLQWMLAFLESSPKLGGLGPMGKGKRLRGVARVTLLSRKARGSRPHI